MTTIAVPLQNRENFAKYLALYIEPGMTVLLTILEWCYKKDFTKINDDLADDLGKSSADRKKNNINGSELNRLMELEGGNAELKNLDITLLYKVIQLTCDLLPRNDPTWTKNCPLAQQGELEYLLFKLKDGRNSLAHLAKKEYFNITDSMVEDKCKEVKDLLTQILEKAALKCNIGGTKKHTDLVAYIDKNVKKIASGKNICDSMSPHTITLIVEELKSKAFSNDDLKASLNKELKEYSVPNVVFQLKDKLEQSQVIVVQGEAGLGKTALSRYLYYSWLSGNTDPVEGLSSFDVVLRIECNQIFSSDINQFYEAQFPNASFAFPNTNSFKRSLDEFRVFWVMDGFDECTDAFKGFLTDMMKSLSDKHIILISSRPNKLEDLKGCLCECKLLHIPCTCKHSMDSLFLELLYTQNVEEIIRSLIKGDKNEEDFRALYNSLDGDAKCLLSNPLNLNLYINLWLQDPKQILNTFTTKKLFVATIMNNLEILKQRLDGRTACSSRYLPRLVDNWFYGSLCKQSILMLMQGRYNIISNECLHILEDDAMKKFDRDPSTFLSTFLRRVEENDGESVEGNEGESEAENGVKIRYKYHHVTQQFVLASLFLKGYSGDDVVDSIDLSQIELRSKAALQLLTFYVELIIEDGSLDENSKDAFAPVRKIINMFPIEHKSTLWVQTSAASNFNEKYMENVSLEIKDVPYLDITHLETLSDMAGFLVHIKPKKIKISDLCSTAKKDGFTVLLHVLSDCEFKNSEVDLSALPNEYAGEIQLGTFKNDTSFRGDYFGLINVSESCQTLENIYVKMYFPSHLHDFCKLLMRQKNKGLKQLEISFQQFFFLLHFLDEADISSLPKEIVAITTLRLQNVNEINLDFSCNFIKKWKGDETLKYKALIHDFYGISKTGERKLLEIADTVSLDSYSQAMENVLKEINDFNLNITDISGFMDTLEPLTNHHENLKNIFLEIRSEDEFRRLLKFLNENKTLSSVCILLTKLCLLGFNLQRFLKKIANSENDFIIPRELVSRTNISIVVNNENFQDFTTLLYKVKGDETLKFNILLYYCDSSSPDQYQVLEGVAHHVIYQGPLLAGRKQDRYLNSLPEKLCELINI